jgi:hypothetical protein
MSKSQEKEQKAIELKDEFERIQEDSKELDVSKYLAKKDDLPDLGEIEIYDYDQDLMEASEKAMDLLESLVDLYLGDSKRVIEHPYIKNKLKEDAMVYAETIFLSKMTRKNFLTQLRQVDNGDNSARMHEVINQTVSQIRDNSKFSSTQRTELEKFYKEIRKDLGLNELSDIDLKDDTEKEKEEASKVMDTRSLNDMIDKYLKNK